MRHLLDTVHRPDVVQVFNVRGKTTVQAKDLVFHEPRQWQVVEEIGKVCPDCRGSVFAQALIVKAVHLRDLPRLVIPSEDRDTLWMPHFQRHQQRHRLHTVVPSVNVVAHKEVVCCWNVTSNSEQLHQIVKLPVHVATHCDWARDSLYIGLFHQHFPAFFCECFHL